MLLQVTENTTNFNITDNIKTFSFSVYYESSKDPDWYKTFHYELNRKSPVGRIEDFRLPVSSLIGVLKK